ncbi:ABC transporter ATP-binding protein [Clostridia bacterium]|nr:ABC transporter ATP-binding protein [Clostridia bacterium]
MIQVKNLTKRYGSNIAVNNISFSVGKGEILGFLGPNGAGKTTTMNILTGYIAATDGECTINGYNVTEEPEKAKEHIGYLPENPPLYDDMTVYEYLSFVSDLKRVPKNSRKQEIDDIIDILKITNMRNRLTKNLSKGYRQRAGLAGAMIGGPEVLVLDEPTIGLDPNQISNMRGVIRGLRERHTVILSSHILPEVSAMCSRVLIINRGRVVASETTERISEIDGSRKFQIRVKGEPADVLAALAKIPAVKKSEPTQEAGTSEFVLTATGGDDIREGIFNALAEKSLPMLMFKPLGASLEDIFIRVTAGELDAETEEESANDGDN